MSEPYIGEIRLFAGNFAPLNWMFCNGATLPISQYDALFALIGTTYGGDGQQTFNLPDLQGRIPIHQGSGFVIGQKAGTETVTLNANQISNHSHPLLGSKLLGTSGNPAGLVPAGTTSPDVYTTQQGSVPMSAASTSSTVGNQPHDNMQPYLCISFIISLFGVFPTQN